MRMDIDNDDNPVAQPADVEGAVSLTLADTFWKGIEQCHHSLLHPECMSCLQGHAARMEMVANAATPADIAERARRAVATYCRRYANSLRESERQRLAAIIAAGFTGGEKGGVNG